MSLSQNKVPLGAVLQQAGLISADNVKEALQQQQQDNNNLRIGEILAEKGYINPKTADFFAEYWPDLIQSPPEQKPIGQYLKQAALLNERQIQSILAQQKQSNLKFGELAIARGWLSPTTVNFFLQYIAPKALTITSGSPVKSSLKSSKVKSAQEIHQDFYKIKLKLLNLKEQEAYSEPVLERVLWWTGGQSWLTPKILKLIAANKNTVLPGKEAEQIDYLIQTKLIPDWRNQEIGDHLIGIEKRLLDCQELPSQQLLRLYQKISTSFVTPDNSREQKKLIKMGLVVKQQEQLVVANRIYQLAFNPSWIQTNLNKMSGSDTNSAIAIVPQKTSALDLSKKDENKKSFQLRNLILLIALVTLLLVFYNNFVKRVKVRTAFKQGNELLKQKSFAEAVGEYNTILNLDSNYFQAWTNRGYALAGLQQYHEMRESCATATIIDPTAIYAWNCQGEALHNLQREEEAIEAFEKAIALNQSDPIFWINKSESLNALGRYEESLVTIEEAIKLLEQIETAEGREEIEGEFSVALTFLGNDHRRKRQYEPAIANYNRALEYSPNYFPAQIGKGIVLNRAKRYQEAQDEFLTILNDSQISTTRQAQTWFYLGKTFCSSQQYSSGVKAFERAIDLRPDYQAAKEALQKCG